MWTPRREFKPLHPHPLRSIINRLEYKPGYKIELWTDETHGIAALAVQVQTVDSRDPATSMVVQHTFPTPPPFIEWDEHHWLRWLLHQIINVERHEACEFLKIDGEAPFFPDHANPYAIPDIPVIA